MITFPGFNQDCRFFHGFGTKNDLQLPSHWPCSEVQLNQVHGASVFDLKKFPPEVADLSQGYDGVVTSLPEVVLTIKTADCLPVLFYSEANQRVGACHAGWRGLRLGILQATLQSLTANKAIGGVRAAIGPGIGADHFEVGDEVVSAFVGLDLGFQAYFKSCGGEKYRGDLYGIAKRILLQAGLDQNKIFFEPRCTFCDPLSFHSYRRDGKSGGRNFSRIGLLPAHL